MRTNLLEEPETRIDSEDSPANSWRSRSLVDNSLWWCRHFQRNVSRQISIAWEQPAALTDRQRRVLLRSLQDFQLGESSEGRHGLARATAYGLRVGDPHYGDAVRLFFAEENRHAAYLARYLRLHATEPIGRSWTDFIFRRVRRLMGLETLITVLLTAELIGEVYYRAVREATGCPVLRAICAQLLRDERMHVRFHVERFRFLRAGRTRLRSRILDAIWRCFFAATRLAVWAKHRRAFRLGGYGLRRFWTETGRGLRGVLRAANGSFGDDADELHQQV
jgi:hypothetical protein